MTKWIIKVWTIKNRVYKFYEEYPNDLSLKNQISRKLIDNRGMLVPTPYEKDIDMVWINRDFIQNINVQEDLTYEG